MSAILVKMPPAMRSAEAPSDSPIAKPMKHGARAVRRDEEQDDEHDHEQLGADQQHADRHAGLQRDRVGREGLALRLANAVREFAKVLTRMPNLQVS